MHFDLDYSKLKNGVRVLTVPMLGTEGVTALVLVRTGSRNETPEQSGMSHVLEHMLFKGTKKYPTPMAIAEAVDGIGAENNAFTGKEYTGYYITSAAKHLPLTLDILSEMVTVPTLPQADLEREREVIVQEIAMYEDEPRERVGEEFENLMYQGSSMGRLIIGTKETVRATTSERLRAYMQEWYRGGNVLVVVAGKIQESRFRIQDLIEEKFGGIPASAKATAGKGGFDPYVSAGCYGPIEQRHFKKKTEQAHFYLGVPGLSIADPRRYALQIAQVVLGGGMSSRLFNEIREKRGLAYYVRAELDAAYDVGYFAVRAGVALEKLSDALKVSREELLKLGATITGAEIAKAKEYLLGHLPLTLEDSMGVAQFLGMRALITDEIRQPEEMEEKVSTVTLTEVQAVLAELVSEEKLRSVVVGPKAS
jgi:predicted Zn-dependent peptidase